MLEVTIMPGFNELRKLFDTRTKKKYFFGTSMCVPGDFTVVNKA
jgi:hypothetical protein